MVRIIIGLVWLALSLPAGAQSMSHVTAECSIANGCMVAGCPEANPCGVPIVGQSDLDRAHDICLKHAFTQGCDLGSCFRLSLATYKSGWESCTKIEAAWGKSESTRKIKLADEAEERDRQFIERVAKEAK